MTRFVLLLAPLALAPTLVPAQAPSETSGTQLLRACKTALRFEDAGNRPSPTDELEGGFCIGMVHGISNTLYLNRPLKPEHPRGPSLVCVPREISNSEGVRVVVRYLEAHPERLRLSEVQLTIEAMTRAFPCSTVD